MSTYGTKKVQVLTLYLFTTVPYLENIGGLDEAETLVGGLEVVQRLPHVALQQTKGCFYVGFVRISSNFKVNFHG
jgi:hypothetical protein